MLRSRKALGRFRREVELAARLNHPNIARIYDSGIFQGLYYYAMELIEGKRLDDHVRQQRLGTRQIMELMLRVCKAVQHAHQHGVIHRDLKPSNILVSPDGQPHVVDFGLATTLVKDDAFRTLSADGEITGTPAYMSPEQAAGRHEELDTRTDVYSLGVVFYELITSEFPYDVSTSMMETLQNIRSREPIRPTKRMASLNRDIEAILLKALAKVPDHRYQSATELSSDIDCWLRGLPILARSDSSLYLLRKLIVRHRYTSMVAGLLLVIVLGFLGFSVQLLAELSRSNTQLAAQKEQLTGKIETFTDYAQLVVFTEFLKHWHSDQPARAALFADAFGGNTREEEAIRFLQDGRTLSAKIQAFKQRLQKHEPGFVEFVLAEHHLKDGDQGKAVQAYRASLSHTDAAHADPWLKAWIRGRLYELIQEDQNRNHPVESRENP